ncbi:MAG TPA: RluA family pseudouridine synthase [Rhodocyclaceae bacterium]
MSVPTAAYRPPPDEGLAVVYADDWLLVLDKPAGLLSVPGRGADKADCLVARAQREFADSLIVHRLDMETSGLIVLARGEEMHRRLSRQFREREVAKRYVAVAAGQLVADEGSIDLPLITDWPNRPRQKVDHDIGKPSLTHYRVLSRDADTTRVELEPVTGRSHQLRVHLLSLGHPLLGDRLYAPQAIAEAVPRLLLHAWLLAFTHPQTGITLNFERTAEF